MNYIILIIGFFLLIKGADIFVDGAANLAKKIGIPSVIVGLTIVSLGTSAPELSVSIVSALQGTNDLVIGNVLGSNIFNTLVVLGGTAVAAPILFEKITIRRDYIVNTLVAILSYVLIFGLTVGIDGELSRIDGIILLLACAAYIIVLVKASIKDGVKEENSGEIKILSNIIRIFVGIAGIVIGGNLVVDSATAIALSLNMSEKLVGLTIVAMGTSLPELVTSVVAALKGEKEMALGNVLGSNIFNLLLILGASTAINPCIVGSLLGVDFLFFIVITLLIGASIFLNKKKEKKIGRVEGIIYLLTYAGYLTFIVMRG